MVLFGDFPVDVTNALTLTSFVYLSTDVLEWCTFYAKLFYSDIPASFISLKHHSVIVAKTTTEIQLKLMF